ncbi:hypothetical protein [Streptococcus equi]|nr:hypothetical protein [Streptococcus equi]CRV08522.1 Uncharacterised protein [Streptococcus equi subsp. equi]CRV12050.1 Uncharacterised protein [Streptococcus equi subsp. equi]
MRPKRYPYSGEKKRAYHKIDPELIKTEFFTNRQSELIGRDNVDTRDFE